MICSSLILTEYFSPGVICAEQLLQPRHLLHTVFWSRSSGKLYQLCNDLSLGLGWSSHSLFIIAHRTWRILVSYSQRIHHPNLEVTLKLKTNCKELDQLVRVSINNCSIQQWIMQVFFCQNQFSKRRVRSVIKIYFWKFWHIIQSFWICSNILQFWLNTRNVEINNRIEVRK